MENDFSVWERKNPKPAFSKQTSFSKKSNYPRSLEHSAYVLHENNHQTMQFKPKKAEKINNYPQELMRINKIQSKHESETPRKQIQSFKSIYNRTEDFLESRHKGISYTTHDLGEPQSRPKIMTRKNSIVCSVEPISSQNFQVLKIMGKGRYGNVYLVQDRKTGFMMALKAISKKIIKQKQIQSQIIREIKIQSYLRHSGIIQLYGMFHDEQNLYLLMELGCDGQLFDLIQSKKILREDTASFLAKNLLEVADYMHSQHILHRDMKPENIVMIMGHPKICDFGWSVYTSPSTEDRMRQTFCGTPLYFSPELLMGKKYDEKVDLWAIGVMVYEFLIGKSPFGLKSQNDLQKIITDSIDFDTVEPVSYYCKQFISRSLIKNPINRSTSKQLLKTWFIRKYANMEICEELCESFPILKN